MEVVIKEEDSDLEKELRESKALLEDGIDISKFLREDLSINLELLEIAISLIINTRQNLYISGIDEYYTIRKIKDNKESLIEETMFILRYIQSVVEELSETGEKEIYFNGS